MTARPLSLYIHIPFCKRRCPYCTFYHVSGLDAFEDAFIASLLAELEAAREELSGFRAETLFLGGGTPSVLEKRSLDAIFRVVEPHLDSMHEPEITTEVNPEDVTDAVLRSLRDYGVNRISVGLQSMDAQALRSLGRCTPAVNRRALEQVASTFDNFSVDVLLGVPGASGAHLSRTLDAIAEVCPPHISAYCLEPGGALESEAAPFLARVDAEQSAEDYLQICKVLEKWGYAHYEVSNFARPGFASRHNRAYWSGAEYLGLGPGAHSFINGTRFHNEPDIRLYVESRGGTRGEVRRVDDRRPDQVHLEMVMLSLRTSDGIARRQLRCAPSLVDDLVTSGLAVENGDRVVLTDRGYLLLNEVVDRLTRAGAT